jgi:hypothetical protein
MRGTFAFNTPVENTGKVSSISPFGLMTVVKPVLVARTGPNQAATRLNGAPLSKPDMLPWGNGVTKPAVVGEIHQYVGMACGHKPA